MTTKTTQKRQRGARTLGTIDRTAMYTDADCLVKIGARPATISRLTGLSKEGARKLYRQKHGSSPRKGKAATGTCSLWENNQTCLSALAYLGFWMDELRAAEADESGIPAMARAYARYYDYCLATHLGRLDVERCLYVTDDYRLDKLGVRRCAVCTGHWLAPRHRMAVPRYVCPYCQ